MSLKEKADDALTYFIGGGAVTLPAIVHSLTEWLQFLVALSGFVLVIWRYLHHKDK